MADAANNVAGRQEAESRREPADTASLPQFSLVSGGLLFQFFRKTGLCGNDLQPIWRRVLAIESFAWIPLLVLSAIAGQAGGGAVAVPFLRDVDAQVRFLIALPLLIVAESFVHRRLGSSLQRFLTRRIVLEPDVPAFYSAVQSARRLRDSFAVEIALIIYVYTAGHWIWRSRGSLGEASWYGIAQATHLHLTAAGYWCVFISMPILQFILARWYFRLFIWFQLLWRISRLKLQLDAAHPDRAGGINFLGTASYSFAPILFAQGAILAGIFANRVVLEGRPFLGFKVTAAILAIFWILALLGPLAMFSPVLWRTKNSGRSEYGSLASQYLAQFREKWIVGVRAKGEELLGSADIQSLADMENSYDAVRQMRLVPFGISEVTALAAITLAPLLPLILTVYSLDQIVVTCSSRCFRRKRSAG